MIHGDRPPKEGTSVPTWHDINHSKMIIAQDNYKGRLNPTMIQHTKIPKD